MLRFVQTSVLKTLITVFPILIAVTTQAAVIKRDSALLDAPSPRASEIGSVSIGSEVDFKQRKGLWAEICAGNVCGWLRITAVDLKNQQGPTQTNLASLKSGREGVGNAVSSTGVRGLDAESIDVGNPDYEAFAALEGFRVSITDADAFAQQGMLERRSLAMLAEPAAESPLDSRAELRNAPAGDRAVVKKKKNKRKQASDDDW